jgi:LPXTG-site transpeptidase (sortase) family protein
MFLGVFIYTHVSNGSRSVVPIVTSSPLSGPGIPLHIQIPKIHVDARIESVGVSADEIGSIATPKDPANAAWFNAGPRPGEKGTAVINGHYGWTGHHPAVFDNLNLLRPGDAIYVRDDNGEVRTFVVSRVKVYGEHEDASDVFVSEDTGKRLNLITCDGVWNNVTQSYSHRLVVFTILFSL